MNAWNKIAASGVLLHGALHFVLFFVLAVGQRTASSPSFCSREASSCPAYRLASTYHTQAVTVATVVGLPLKQGSTVPVAEATIDSIHQMFRQGTTCSEIVATYMQRIKIFDKVTGLNSLRIFNPVVMDVARQKDSELRELLALNKTLPPLFCAPILVKDNFDTIGMAATAGAVGLLDNVASENAFVVQKVIDRGALVLGKFNMGEFALSPDESTGSVFGIVRNPYDLDHTTAGSSGGGAAALAANLALLALGTDTGNSIRGPAAHCGVVGLRPSLGVTSRSGVVPARLNRDTTGPLARTVADAARLFEAMVGYDPKDNLTSLLLQERMDQNYSQFLQVDGLEGARVGVLRQLSDTPTTDPEVLSLFNQAVADMAANGATIVDDFTIDGNDMGLSWSGYLDGKGIAYGFWNVNGSWEDLWNCQVAFPYDFDAYASAPNKTQHFNSLQALYTAGAFHPSVASDLRDALAQRFTPAEYPPPLLRALGFRCGCLDFFTDPCRTEFRRRLVESMDNAEVDVVAFPTWSNPPRLIGDTVSPDGNNSPTIAPHTGAPAITVPMGFTKAGLPTGLHLLARPFDEGTLFRVAYAYEQATMHRGGSPIFPELLRGSGNVSAQSSASSVPFSG